jgi:hypothetical protein
MHRYKRYSRTQYFFTRPPFLLPFQLSYRDQINKLLHICHDVSTDARIDASSVLLLPYLKQV